MEADERERLLRMARTYPAGSIEGHGLYARYIEATEIVPALLLALEEAEAKAKGWAGERDVWHAQKWDETLARAESAERERDEAKELIERMLSDDYVIATAAKLVARAFLASLGDQEHQT